MTFPKLKCNTINADDTINIDKALDDIADLKEESKELHDKLEKILRDCNAKYTPTKECDSIKMYFDCMQKFAKEYSVMNNLQLVCIFSIIAIAHAGGDSKENDEKTTKIVEECRKATGASDKDVEAFEAYEFPKTKTQACLVTCYYKKVGIMNNDNTINIDKVIEEFTENEEEEDKELHDKYVAIMKDCHTKYTPAKECDSIKTYFDCMLNSAKEAGIPLEK
ncbi:Odorant-binding protein 19d [Carabus blaptoides fortunei]